MTSADGTKIIRMYEKGKTLRDSVMNMSGEGGHEQGERHARMVGF
jgi:hypothetical protein